MRLVCISPSAKRKFQLSSNETGTIQIFKKLYHRRPRLNLPSTGEDKTSARKDWLVDVFLTTVIKILFTISRRAWLCKSTADTLISSINELLPIIQEIKYSGVELPSFCQFQLNGLSKTLRNGLELARKAFSCSWWDIYEILHLARRMEKLDKRMPVFVNGPIQAHVLADVLI
ncbi:Probable disease resistance protein At4g33300 [Linum perenne]